ncbi:MAG: choline/carnitine O-acyltransferase [Lautropia sp.]|nr:choline/carnitine O-acyltransferase [Lautropia sp.]
MSANPHLPRLPIAELDDSCQRYLEQVQPLLSADELAKTTAIVQAFQANDGVRLHEALHRFDHDMMHAGKSWLIDTWLTSYLAGREPLPLVSNVGFQLQTADHSLADWIAALTAVCADYQHGRIKPTLTPQGTPCCMHQWAILKGASRIPRPQVDDYFIHPTGGHYIGIFHRGHYYRLLALDTYHEARSAEVFQAALMHILQAPDANPFPVGVPSFLPRDEAANAFARLGAHPNNAELIRHLAKDLFHVVLVDEALDEDHDLSDATFAPTQGFWCHKPITLRYNLATRRLYAHSEHTAQDGGTLQAAIRLARQKLPAQPVHRPMPSIPSAPSAPTTPDKASTPERNPSPGMAKNALGTPGMPGAHGGPAGDIAEDIAEDIGLQRHDWVLDDTLKANWPIWFERYAKRAGQMRISTLRMPFDDYTIPSGISQDALVQFLLQYAQLHTWGQVRNTYEAVDVSHFQRGRTECVRPVSVESLRFVQHWHQKGLDFQHPQESPSTNQHADPDSTTVTYFKAALHEHKARIKICKQGLGPNRQLLGLQQMALKQQLPMPALYTDDGYRRFTTDFLSTSTVGDDSITINFGFAPTSTGGLGINYTMTPAGWLITISHTADQQTDVDRFRAALKSGAQALLRFVQLLKPTRQHL